MNKVWMLLLSLFMLTACSTEDSDSDALGKTEETPSTEVYAMGKRLAAVSTRADATPAQYTDAYFFIRVDGRIPGMSDAALSNDYIPYNGGSVFSPENKGKVDLSYPDWKVFSTTGNTRQYVYDTTGEEVNKVISDIPTYESLLTVNKKYVDKFASLDTKNLKIIWYVAKFSYGKWHVDGILTFEDTKDVTDIPGFDEEPGMNNSATENKLPKDFNGNIEVDIHQQQHSTWQEIKTSVHVRDLVEKTVVEIPLEYEHIAEVDDFAIRTYDLDLDAKVFINGKEYELDSSNPVKVTIEHKADKAVFTIVCKDAKYLKALHEQYNDGVTVEIHTYPKNLTNEEVWARLKNAKVSVTPSDYKNLIFNGATSTFFTE